MGLKKEIRGKLPHPPLLCCHLSFLYHQSLFFSADTDYISQEELAKVEQMLGHLSEESKQAAASTLVSFHLMN